MINLHVVKLIKDYLDSHATKNTSATLLGLNWYVDSRNKTLPLLEEIDQALNDFSTVGIERKDNDVFFVFGSLNTGKHLTKSDIDFAETQYRKDFASKLKKIT